MIGPLYSAATLKSSNGQAWFATTATSVIAMHLSLFAYNRPTHPRKLNSLTYRKADR